MKSICVLMKTEGQSDDLSFELICGSKDRKKLELIKAKLDAEARAKNDMWIEYDIVEDFQII